MTCSRSTGMTDLSMPPSRAMTSACSWALSPSTSLTSNEDVRDGLWAALNAGTSRAYATASRAMTTTVRFSTVNGTASVVPHPTYRFSASILLAGIDRTRVTARKRFSSSRAQQLAELLRVWRPRFGVLERDVPTLDEGGERVVHRSHADLLTGLDRAVDLVSPAVANQRPDRRRPHHDLGRQGEPTTDARQQRQAQHGLQRQRQLGADLLLPVLGEDVDDPVNRVRARARVQGREREMPRLRQGQHGLDRLDVAHLSDEHHVGALAEDAAQRPRERRRVTPHLALLHAAQLVGVHELDRVLDRHDVLGVGRVDELDHRGQGGRFTAARRARDED